MHPGRGCVLRTRVLTAAIALPTVLAVVILAPNWFFILFIAVLGAFGLYEVAAMTDTLVPIAIPLFVVVGGGPLLGTLDGREPSWIVPVAVIAAMLALVVQVAAVGGGGGLKGMRLALAGAVYVGVLFPYFALLRNGRHGVELIILMLLIVVASDTGALFAGMYLGRVKLIPRVSPNKTVEGAVGGLAASIAAGLILRGLLVPDWTAGAAAGVAAAISILAQLGDLAGSALKRSAGVKDSGWLFPGHGGLLDRTSSLVFAVVFTYYYSR